MPIFIDLTLSPTRQSPHRTPGSDPGKAVDVLDLTASPPKTQSARKKRQPFSPAASPDECPICLSSHVDCTTSLAACGHSFCFSCISQWALSGRRCPICRQEFSSLLKDGTNIRLAPLAKDSSDDEDDDDDDEDEDEEDEVPYHHFPGLFAGRRYNVDDEGNDENEIENENEEEDENEYQDEEEDHDGWPRNRRNGFFATGRQVLPIASSSNAPVNPVYETVATLIPAGPDLGIYCFRTKERDVHFVPVAQRFRNPPRPNFWDSLPSEPTLAPEIDEDASARRQRRQQQQQQQQQCQRRSPFGEVDIRELNRRLPRSRSPDPPPIQVVSRAAAYPLMLKPAEVKTSKPDASFETHKAVRSNQGQGILAEATTSRHLGSRLRLQPPLESVPTTHPIRGAPATRHNPVATTISISSALQPTSGSKRSFSFLGAGTAANKRITNKNSQLDNRPTKQDSTAHSSIR